ncbi:MAG: T9SS type A sorting domain-containing protein, partial [Hymenobacteraceae bacterium]|nr:T9SS type A sorting domain-containing protein [Hymenobacteraceae bacterium]
APGDTARFEFPQGWVRPAPGDHRLVAWVKTAAAQPDGLAANDTLATMVQVATRDVPRRVLQEIATSSSCPPCVIFDDSLRAKDRRYPGLAIERIAYPLDFPGAGDPYYLPEFRARVQVNVRNIRNVPLPPQVVAPDMVAAGATVVDPTGRFFSTALPAYVLEIKRLQLFLAPLALTGTCRVRGDTVSGAVTIDPVRWLPGRTHSLLVVIKERRTTGNASTNGQTEFHDVAKKILPTRVLTAPLVPGQLLTIPYSYFFAPGHTVEHFDSLEVVAFVQNTSVIGTSLSAEVVQAVRLWPGAVLGAPAEVAIGGGLRLAPNPTSGLTTAHFSLSSPQRVAVDVFDALGRRVLYVPARELAPGPQTVLLPLLGVPAGLYVVRLMAGSLTRTQRLVVE